MPIRLILFSLLAITLYGAGDWTVISSPNFELITNAGAGDGRRVVEYFEQVRDFFTQKRSARVDSKLPVTIILFRSEKDFRPYSPSESAAAFYTGDQSRDYIVMAGSADNERPIAVHEYMHLLMRRLEIKVPSWLDEGIAEVYSTITPYAGKIAVGAVSKGRAYALNNDKWLETSRMFAVHPGSPDYNGKQHSGAFYAQSWLSVHMLMLSPKYAPKFSEFLGAVSGGLDSAAALQKVYGKTVPDFTRDLQAYYRSTDLRVALFDTKFAKVGGDEPRKADDFIVELHLARIQASSRARSEESLARLERLAAGSPDRWEVHDALGQVCLRQGKVAQARAALRRAVELKPDTWSVYWDYARVASGDSDDRELVLMALRRTVELNPEHVDAQIQLGEHLVQMDRFADAMRTFDGIQKVTPDRAPRMFLGKSYAAIRLGNWQVARLAALTALKYATEETDKGRAGELIAYLNRRQQAELAAKKLQEGAPNAVSTEFSKETATDDRPRLARTQPPGQPDLQELPAAEPLLSRVEGTLQMVDCGVNNAILHVQSGEAKTIRVQVYDPDKITIRNEPGSSVTLTCGPQRVQPKVIVEFLDRVDEKNRTVGEVRAIEFRSADRGTK